MPIFIALFLFGIMSPAIARQDSESKAKQNDQAVLNGFLEKIDQFTGLSAYIGPGEIPRGGDEEEETEYRPLAEHEPTHIAAKYFSKFSDACEADVSYTTKFLSPVIMEWSINCLEAVKSFASIVDYPIELQDPHTKEEAEHYSCLNSENRAAFKMAFENLCAPGSHEIRLLANKTCSFFAQCRKDVSKLLGKH